MRNVGSPNICQTPPGMILGTRSSAAPGVKRAAVKSNLFEEVWNAKARRVRVRLGPADRRRNPAGGRRAAARQSRSQHGGRDERAGARSGTARLKQGEEMAKYLYLLYADESKMPAPDNPQKQQPHAALCRYYE